MSPGRVSVGVILMALGVLFLLDQAGYLNAGRFIGSWWPAVIILVGLVQLVARPGAPVGPGIVVAVGLILLVGQLGFVPGGAFNALWPIVLIAIGLSLLLNRVGRGARHSDSHDRVDRFVVFGGMDLAVRSPGFAGGSLTALFGGINLDLRESALAPDGATLEIFAAFGGINIRVPDAWHVNVSGVPIFGALEDKTAGGAASADSPTIDIRATVLFGGVEIKH